MTKVSEGSETGLSDTFFVAAGKEENVMAVKYVFVTGGVVSGLGKGITAAPWDVF